MDVAASSELSPNPDAPAAEAARREEGLRAELRNRLAQAGEGDLLPLLLADQSRCWQRGYRLRVEDYLDAFPEVRGAGEEVLRALISGEMHLRAQHGEPATVEEYRSRFPDHAGWLEQRFSDSRLGDPLATKTRLGPAQPPAGRGPTPETVASNPGAPPTSDPAPAPPAAATRPSLSGPTGGVEVPGYEILGELGRGGMGVVYKARQLILNRIVALKMIRGGDDAGPDQIARFLVEAEAIARLRHPNIVQIHDVGTHNNRAYCCLEFVEGGSLDRKLSGAPQPPGDAARLLEVLARAVHAAHQAGIIHRDLKPGNILLTADGQPKVTDFGLAKQIDEDDAWRTLSGAIMGTPCYMAPEQAHGRTREVGPAADTHALGAILYELLTGRPPFRAPTMMDTLDQVRHQEPVPPSRLQPRIPRDLEIICLKCLQKEVGKRYASAMALAEDLHRFLHGEPIRARAVPAWERGIKWARRRPAVAALALMTGLSGLSLTVGGVLYQDKRARVAEAKAREATQELRDRQRHDEVQQLVFQGQQASRDRDWQGAELYLTRALDRIGPDEPLLEQPHAQAERLLRQAQRNRAAQKAREEALKKYNEDFLPLRNEALFHATLAAGGQQPASRQAAREKARAALLLFEVRPEAPGPVALEGALDAPEQERILADCYELLVVLADTEADPLPGEATAGQLRQALRTLDRAASLGYAGHPTRAYHLRRGRYLDQLGDDAGARAERRRADAQRPATALDFYLVGDEHYKQGDVAEAARDFAGALTLEPDRFWARYFLAICDLMLERPADARSELNLCLRQESHLPWLYVLRGFANGRLQEYQAAQDDFAQALKLDSSGDAAYALYANRGILWFQQGKFDEAVADLRRAIGMKPKEYQPYVSLAQVYQKQGRRDDAVAQLDAAVGLEPELAFLYRLRARLHLEGKDFDAALRDADRALEAETQSGSGPTLARDYVEKGRILYLCGRYREAAAACDEALKLRPNYPAAHLQRADAALRLGQYREAADSLDAYLKVGGKPQAGVYQARAVARAELDDPAGAIEDCTVALTLKPDDPDAVRMARGWAYLGRGAAPLALADFEEILRHKPGQARAYTGRGLARVQLGRVRPALADAEAALRQGEMTSRLVYDASRIYAQAVGRLDAETGDRAPPAQRLACQDRALDLLREALRLLPAAERAPFWREHVRPDPAFRSVRASSAYALLDREYP
jgi:tetratricopeptide (TPR) repeat protein